MLDLNEITSLFPSSFKVIFVNNQNLLIQGFNAEVEVTNDKKNILYIWTWDYRENNKEKFINNIRLISFISSILAQNNILHSFYILDMHHKNHHTLEGRVG